MAKTNPKNSDTTANLGFEAKHAELEAQKAHGADPEDRDEYCAASIFWVPKEACWAHLTRSAAQPTIGTLVDGAMVAIERDNPEEMFQTQDITDAFFATTLCDASKLGASEEERLWQPTFLPMLKSPIPWGTRNTGSRYPRRSRSTADAT